MVKKIEPILLQMSAAITGIATALAGKTLEEFRSDWLLKHGVQRGIEIISEAARRLPDSLLQDHPDIPWRKIKAIGNILRHEYHAIQDEVIWDVAQSRLQPLQTAIDAMLVKLRCDGG